MRSNDPMCRSDRLRTRPVRSPLFGVVAWLFAAAALLPVPVAAQFGSGPQAYPHDEFEIDDPTSLAFSPNDRFLAIGDSDGNVFVFDVEAGRKIEELRPVRSRVVGIEFSADGSALFVAAEDERIVEVDLLSGSVAREGRTDKKIRSFDLSPDGRWIVWGGDDGRVELLSSRMMTQNVFESPNMYNQEVLFTAFGLGGSEVFAAAKDDARFAFWGTGMEEPIRRDEREREENRAFAKDRDGQLLAIGVKGLNLVRNASTRGAIQATASNSVRILDWNRGRIVREIEELPDEVSALAISPDRSLIAVALENGEVEGYSTQEARSIMSISEGDRAYAMEFSPAGSWLAAAMDNRVMVWEMSGAAMATTSAPGGSSMGGGNVVRQGDVLAQSGKYEFTTGRDPLITTFDRFTMAVLDLDNLGVEQSLAASVMNLIVSRLANVGYIELVERADVQQVIDELKLQNTGITSAREAAEIGRLLNAQNVLLGNVNQLGSSLTVAVRLVETETGRVLGAREILCRNCRPEDLPQGMSLLISSLVQMN